MTGMSYYLYLCFLVSPAWMAGADVILFIVFLLFSPCQDDRDVILFIFVFSCFPCLDGRGGCHFIYCVFTVFPPVRMTWMSYYLYLCFLFPMPGWQGRMSFYYLFFFTVFPPVRVTGMSYYLFLCFLVSPAWMAGMYVIITFSYQKAQIGSTPTTDGDTKHYIVIK